MSSSGARATRSRFSSPAQQQTPAQQDEGINGHGHASIDEERRIESNNAAVMANKQQSIRQWLEPSIENKASSEQAGFAKAGVLGGMAALGELPKLPRKNGENGHPKTRIILRQTRDSAAASPHGAASPAPRTPDVGGAARTTGHTSAQVPLTTASAAEATTATPEPRPYPNSPSHNYPASAPNRAPARKALPMNEDGDRDEDYDPKEATRRKSMPKPAPPKRGRPPSTMRRSSLPPTKPSPVKQMRPETPPAPQVTQTTQVTQGPQIVQPLQPTQSIHPVQAAQHPVQAVTILPSVPDYEPQGAGFAEMVVEAAVDEALTHNRFPTAWALRTLYDTKAGDSGFVLMVEKVFSQTADAATLKEFARLLKEKKREGKRDNTGREYFVPPDPNDTELRLPKVASYARFLHRNSNTAPAPAVATASVPAPVPEAPHVQEAEGEVRASKKLKISHRSQDNTPQKMAATPGINGAKTPGSRKRARRHSGSSASSLSSIEGLSSPELPETSELVPPPGTHDLAQPSFPDASNKTEAKKARAKTEAAAGPRSPSQSGSRPMNTRRKSTKPQQQHQFVSSAFGSNSESPTTPLSPSHDLPPSANFKTFGGGVAMPGRITSAAEQQLSAKNKAQASANKATVPTEAAAEELKETWERRRGAQKVTNGYQAAQSSVRDDEDPREMTPMRSTRKTRQSILPQASTRATRSAKKVTDEVQRYDSPGAFSFSAQGDGSSVMGSRAVTPTNFRPAKKPKTGLRIKSSPVKKKGGTAAGVPRSMGDAQSFVFNGPNKEQADNDEYCSACGNSGDVVCCDGCPRSFHFECVDMVQSSDLPEDWYCNECIVKRWPSRVPTHKGVFGGPLNQLEKSIPRAFSLPKRLQNRFEGVRAGADGDYEEISATKTTARRTKNGFEDIDLYKQRDDGEAVLCHHCQKSATEGHPIVSCSACPLYWHIDCLDPPLAVPPPAKTWKCPAHADELLQERPPLAPAHRYRKIKGAQTVTPALSRGLKNNGHIELDWGSEPEDDEDNSGWRDMASFGRTYKVSAKGVRLDFIEQLRKHGAGRAPSKESLSREEPYLTPPVEDTVQRPPAGEERNVEEMQASLVLASLKQSAPSALDQLVSALLASASPDMIALIARGDAANIARDTLASQDKVSLMALLEEVEGMGSRIRELLGRKSETVPEPSNEQPSATTQEKTDSADKMEIEPLVTEPTPPSTIDHEGVMDFE